MEKFLTTFKNLNSLFIHSITTFNGTDIEQSNKTADKLKIVLKKKNQVEWTSSSNNRAPQQLSEQSSIDQQKNLPHQHPLQQQQHLNSYKFNSKQLSQKSHSADLCIEKLKNLENLSLPRKQALQPQQPPRATLPLKPSNNQQQKPILKQAPEHTNNTDKNTQSNNRKCQPPKNKKVICEQLSADENLFGRSTQGSIAKTNTKFLKAENKDNNALPGVNSISESSSKGFVSSSDSSSACQHNYTPLGEVNEKEGNKSASNHTSSHTFHATTDLPSDLADKFDKLNFDATYEGLLTKASVACCSVSQVPKSAKARHPALNHLHDSIRLTQKSEGVESGGHSQLLPETSLHTLTTKSNFNSSSSHQPFQPTTKVHNPSPSPPPQPQPAQNLLQVSFPMEKAIEDVPSRKISTNKFYASQHLNQQELQQQVKDLCLLQTQQQSGIKIQEKSKQQHAQKSISSQQQNKTSQQQQQQQQPAKTSQQQLQQLQQPAKTSQQQLQQPAKTSQQQPTRTTTYNQQQQKTSQQQYKTSQPQLNRTSQQQQHKTTQQLQKTSQQLNNSEVKSFSYLSTPLITISNKEQADSESLASYVNLQDTCIIRGLCHVLDFRLDIFSTISLRKQHGDFSMEIRVQPKKVLTRGGKSSKNKDGPVECAEAKAPSSAEGALFNTDPHLKEEQKFNTANSNTNNNTNSNTNNNNTTKTRGTQRTSWHFPSHPSTMTIRNYAKYQALSFVKAKSLLINGRLSRSVPSRKDYINFATNLDLSSPQHWNEQINEVNKLPDFLKVHCPNKNILNHIGHNVLGVNTIQLYMKVPGCRTTGHQENNNFAAVNVNVGPGSCEWFCVPIESWPAICRMCKKRGLNQDSSAWWPDVEDLKDEGIPFYHLLQLPGDTVWVGPGTVHWVQALGWCNNIAWNVGSFTAYQYKCAMHRYMVNQQEPPFKSIVPMIQVSWNLMWFFLQQEEGAGGSEGGGGGGGETFGGSDGRPSGDEETGVARAPVSQGSCAVYGDHKKNNVATPLKKKNAKTFFFTPHYKDLLSEVLSVLQEDVRRMDSLVEECAGLGRQIIRQQRLPSDLAHYCTVCLVEVFNVLFVSKNVVFCYKCALKRSSSLKDFYVLAEYELSHLTSSLHLFATKVAALQ